MSSPGLADWGQGWRAGALLLLVLLVGVGAEILFGQEVYWAHDLRHHYHPWRHWVAETWSEGRLPLWCSQVANGFPLMADGQAGVFYAPYLVLGWLLPSHHALSFSILLHTAWAFLGARLLARDQGLDEAPSTLAAVAFAFSGFMSSHVTYAGMYAVASWLPWGVLSSQRISQRAWRWGPLWGLSVAAMFTAGHPQAAAISALGCLLLFSASARRVWAAWAAAGAWALAGLMAASTQLLATIELAGFSAREGGVSEEFAGMGSLPPQEILNAILPRFWGWEPPADIPLTYVHKGPAYFGTGENHWEDCFYLGIPVFILAVLGWRGAPRRWRWLLVGALLLMLGRFTPVYGLFHLLPGFDHFRFPVRFSLLLTLAASLLAGFGTQWLLQQRSSPSAERWLGRGIVVFVVAAGLGSLALSQVEPILRDILSGALGGREGAEERIQAFISGMEWNTSLLSPGVLWPASLAAATLGIARALRLGRLHQVTAGMALAVLTALDLGLFMRQYNPTTPAELAGSVPEVVSVITEEPGLYRSTVVDRVQPPELDPLLVSASMGLLHGTRDVILLSPLLLPRHERLLAAAGLDVGMDHGPQKARQVEERLALSELMGVRYLSTVHRLQSPRLEEVHQEGLVRTYRNDSAQSRAFLVSCVELAQDPDEAMERLLELDPRERAVVEGLEEPFCASSRPQQVDITEYSDERIRMRVQTQQRSLLVLTDTWYPGWIAEVNGAEQEILLANVDFRGLALEPGASEVVFRYQPDWAWSLWLTLLAWLGLLISGGAALWRRG